jgi:hypothetical protein
VDLLGCDEQTRSTRALRNDWYGDLLQNVGQRSTRRSQTPTSDDSRGIIGSDLVERGHGDWGDKGAGQGFITAGDQNIVVQRDAAVRWMQDVLGGCEDGATTLTGDRTTVPCHSSGGLSTVQAMGGREDPVGRDDRAATTEGAVEQHAQLVGEVTIVGWVAADNERLRHTSGQLGLVLEQVRAEIGGHFGVGERDKRQKCDDRFHGFQGSLQKAH